MSLLSGVIDSAKSAITSHLPNISNLTKNTTKLDAFKTVGTGTHDIQQMQYPADLTVASDQPHWVTFYINVRGKSKIAQQSPDQLATGQPVSITGENRIDPTKMDNSLIAGATMYGAVEGLGAGWKIGKDLGAASRLKSLGKGSSETKAGLKGLAVAGTTALVGGTLGGVAGGAAASMIVKPDTTYRLKDAITLHIAQSPSTHYSAQYDTVEFGALGGFAAGGSSYADTLDQSQQNQEAMLAAARKAMKGPANLITAGAGKGLVEATTKQTLNPYREVLFKSIDFRKFAFDYRFYPSSAAETMTVQKIIKTFRYHMHPEMSSGGLYYIHPSEFNIQYYFRNQENEYLNKISTCVLTDMHVVYGPSEGFSTFNDGAPTEISMRLIFTELETLTKERIDAGY